MTVSEKVLNFAESNTKCSCS